MKVRIEVIFGSKVKRLPIKSSPDQAKIYKMQANPKMPCLEELRSFHAKTHSKDDSFDFDEILAENDGRQCPASREHRVIWSTLLTHEEIVNNAK